MRHIEQNLQMNIVSFLRLQYPKLLFTISPGGLLTSTRVGGKAKKLGYSQGMPDLAIFKPSGNYKGLFIELKTKKGILSKQQKTWLAKLNENGYLAIVCRNLEEATKQIRKYFLEEK